MTAEKLSAKDICYTGLFTALTAVMAQISVPMPFGVPFTMQTFAVTLTGVTLGAKKGFYATLAYVLLGAAGLPVFANLKGGIGILLGPTGGFLISFPVMAWIIGYCAEKRGAVYPAAGLLAGTAANYILGMVMFAAVTGKSCAVAFSACVVPFIPTAIIKMILAGFLGAKLRKKISFHRDNVPEEKTTSA